jgi:hypothetical protein
MTGNVSEFFSISDKIQLLSKKSKFYPKNPNFIQKIQILSKKSKFYPKNPKNPKSKNLFKWIPKLFSKLLILLIRLTIASRVIDCVVFKYSFLIEF